MKGKIKLVITLTLAFILVLSTTSLATVTKTKSTVLEGKSIEPDETEDFDPLVDLELTVTIKEIRSLDIIDLFSDPDFYVKVYIGDEVVTSPIWKNQFHVTPNWSATVDVDDTERFVDIRIELWDWNLGKDKLCDISRNSREEPNSYTVVLYYDLATGAWTGDDMNSPVPPASYDLSGYGRLNGCDDNTQYTKDRDCEIWFDITINDIDGDNIPYWIEVNEYGTDPTVDNRGDDEDKDGIPIEWEHKFGIFQHWGHWTMIEYHPNIWDDHKNLDPDNDGLSNYEEYLTWQWGSDPFRQDIFLEIDEMEEGPNGEGEKLPDITWDILYEPYAKQNKVMHVDHGQMGGGDILPFDDNLSSNAGDLQDIYYQYFLNNDSNYWRRGVFHYGLVVYHTHEYCGFVFGTTNSSDGEGGTYRLDSFQVSKKGHEYMIHKCPLIYTFIYPFLYKSFDREYQRAYFYAGGMMHETGHTLGIYSSNSPGCDNSNAIPGWGEWLKWIRYKSCMNYGWTYRYVDYSDGSHGKNDFDDWGNIDLTLFQEDR